MPVAKEAAKSAATRNTPVPRIDEPRAQPRARPQSGMADGKHPPTRRSRTRAQGKARWSAGIASDARNSAIGIQGSNAGVLCRAGRLDSALTGVGRRVPKGRSCQASGGQRPRPERGPRTHWLRCNALLHVATCLKHTNKNPNNRFTLLRTAERDNVEGSLYETKSHRYGRQASMERLHCCGREFHLQKSKPCVMYSSLVTKGRLRCGVQDPCASSFSRLA